MNSRSQIRCYKPAFVLQRYCCTFVANPSDSISDVVIQMHFLSLYKGRICDYSTRTDFKHNSYTNSYTKFLFGSRQIFRNLDFFAQNRKSYTNSYTYSYTRFLGHKKIYKIFKNGLSDSYRQVFKVAGGIKFRIFNCRTYQNSYTYSDTKIRSKHEKTATEALLLRFCCGATGNRTRDTRIFSPLLYQLSYGTKFFFRTSPSFDWDCKGRHFLLTCKFFLTNFQKIYTFLRFGLFFHEFLRNLSQFKVRPRMKWE